MNPPIAWTIAGFDSGGGAGIAADLRAFGAMGVHGAVVTTALTAQTPLEVTRIEPVSGGTIAETITTLARSLAPAAVKIGMLPDAASIRAVADGLCRLPRDLKVVYDPVLTAGSGTDLLDPATIPLLREFLFSRITVLTPNLPEAERLTGESIRSPDDIRRIGRALLAMGPKEVVLKGGHGTGPMSADYWTDGTTDAWILSPRLTGFRTHGAGCAFSSALTAGLALGMTSLDGAILAKAYVNRGLRGGARVGDCPVIGGAPWPAGANSDDFPWLAEEPLASRPAFPPCGPRPLGFYPIVPNLAWVARLILLGVTTIQLRIKGKDGEALHREVEKAVNLARERGCRLFINDHWELALRYRAYGAHLGQEDLRSADIHALSDAGIRLGVSTHGYGEVARALALRPSYMAVGTIYPTTAKPMRSPPQGISGFRLWRRLLDCPLVAIGGITVEKAPELVREGADGIAVMSDVTGATNVDSRVREWLKWRDAYL